MYSWLHFSALWCTVDTLCPQSSMRSRQISSLVRDTHVVILCPPALQLNIFISGFGGAKIEGHMGVNEEQH